MAMTDVNSVTNQIQKFWAPMFMNELREQLLLGGLVNKAYQGEIKQEGDTVYVSQVNAPSGQIKTVGTDADVFDSEQLSLSRVAIQANKRAVAAFEIADLAELQSQIGNPAVKSKIRESLVFAVGKQINEYLKTLVSPSTSGPDHLINSVTDFNATQLLAVRMLAAQAKWPMDGQWYALLDPSYYNDMLAATTITSQDYAPGEAPVIAGQIANKRFGFNILEDNSFGTDQALLFHPDFMHMVMQQEIRFKLSDLHAQKKFGYVLSADIVFGAGLGISGANKHVVVTAASSGSVIS